MSSNEVTSVNRLSLTLWGHSPPCHNPVAGYGWTTLESTKCVFAKITHLQTSVELHMATGRHGPKEISNFLQIHFL